MLNRYQRHYCEDVAVALTTPTKSQSPHPLKHFKDEAAHAARSMNSKDGKPLNSSWRLYTAATPSILKYLNEYFLLNRGRPEHQKWINLSFQDIESGGSTFRKQISEAVEKYVGQATPGATTPRGMRVTQALYAWLNEHHPKEAEALHKTLQKKPYNIHSLPDFRTLSDVKVNGYSRLEGSPVLVSVSGTKNPKQPDPDKLGETEWKLTPPKWRWFLDRWAPWLHRPLTNTAMCFRVPPETEGFRNFLNTQSGKFQKEIEAKTYIAPPASAAPDLPGRRSSSRTGFFSKELLTLFEIAGSSKGGDSQDAFVASYSRKAKPVRNLLIKLKRAKEPLILLGEPGSGKSITLMAVARDISEQESKYIFPKICLYVRLGQWTPKPNPTPDDVEELVYQNCKPEVQPYFKDLLNAGRLIIIFDGMDEMSRLDYIKHTEALSDFAGSKKGPVKTLFACRIADFSPTFGHKRLVLRGFTPKLVREYLVQNLGASKIEFEEELLTVKQISKRLLQSKARLT